MEISPIDTFSEDLGMHNDFDPSEIDKMPIFLDDLPMTPPPDHSYVLIADQIPIEIGANVTVYSNKLQPTEILNSHAMWSEATSFMHSPRSMSSSPTCVEEITVHDNFDYNDRFSNFNYPPKTPLSPSACSNKVIFVFLLILEK